MYRIDNNDCLLYAYTYAAVIQTKLNGEIYLTWINLNS